MCCILCDSFDSTYHIWMVWVFYTLHTHTMIECVIAIAWNFFCQHCFPMHFERSTLSCCVWSSTLCKQTHCFVSSPRIFFLGFPFRTIIQIFFPRDSHTKIFRLFTYHGNCCNCSLEGIGWWWYFVQTRKKKQTCLTHGFVGVDVFEFDT